MVLVPLFKGSLILSTRVPIIFTDTSATVLYINFRSCKQATYRRSRRTEITNKNAPSISLNSAITDNIALFTGKSLRNSWGFKAFAQILKQVIKARVHRSHSPHRPTPLGLHRGKVVSVTMKIITQKQKQKNSERRI